MSFSKKVTFTELKAIVNSKVDASIQAFLSDDHWFLSFSDGAYTLITTLSTLDPAQAADVTDFVTNFLPTANGPIDVKEIKGATDGTFIGNVDDKMKVTLGGDGTGSTGGPQSWSPNLEYVDMNVASGGIARDTSVGNTFTTIFLFSGIGLLAGFLITFEKLSMAPGWDIRLLIDSKEIFKSSGINTKDLVQATIYAYNKGGSSHDDGGFLGFNIEDKDSLRWNGPLNYPIAYKASVEIKIRVAAGGAAKKFRAGLVALTKET